MQKAEAELKSAQKDYLYAKSILAHKNGEKTDLENQLAKQNEIVANAQKEYALAKLAYDKTLTDYTATQTKRKHRMRLQTSKKTSSS